MLSRSGQWPNVAKQWCPLSEDFVSLRTSTECGPKCAPHWRTLSRSGLWPNVAQNVPLVGGLCHAPDFDQIWPKMCPSSEDFVMQQNSTKCGPKCAPHWKNFVVQRTLTKCSPKCAPRWRTLSRSGLWPNVAQNVLLVRGLCHTAFFDQKWSEHVPLVKVLCYAADFDQMWPKMCPSLEDFVTQRTLTIYCPNMCPWTDDFVLLWAGFNHIWINNVLIIEKGRYQANGF